MVVQPQMRMKRPSWRDPRLGLGILLIAVSVAIGSWSFTRADATVTVLAAAETLTPGQSLDTAELVEVKVNVPQARDTYIVPGDEALDTEVVYRSVGEGELVPRAALSQASKVHVRSVSVPVDNATGAALAPGLKVDIWVVPAPSRTEEAAEPPSLLASGVEVDDIDESTGLFAGTNEMTAHLLVPEDSLASVLAATSSDDSLMIVPIPA